MRFFNSYRQVVAVVGCCAGLGVMVSLVLQYWVGMEPCVMCIQQRLAMLGMALMASWLVFVPMKNRAVFGVASLLLLLPTGLGLWVAMKQIYLQSLPTHLQPSCGAPWTFRLRNWFGFEWWEPLVRGMGQCGEVHYIVGIPLPVWSACFFAGITVYLAWAYWKKR